MNNATLITEAIKAGIQLYHERRERPAVTALLPLARLGIAEAQYRLAKVYLRACTSPTTDSILQPRARKWLRSAGSRHHPLAQYELTLDDEQGNDKAASEWGRGGLAQELYRRDDFTPQSEYAFFLRQRGNTADAFAMSALTHAAESGMVEAMRDLGEILWTSGAKRDALVWVKRAALANSLHAQYLLGLWFATDSDVQDNHSAKHWYGVAAQAGSADALFNLGQMLLDESKLAGQEAENVALDHLLLAAMRESQEAQLYLARLYKSGIVFQKDDVVSGFWSDRANQWARRMELFSVAFANSIAAEDE